MKLCECGCGQPTRQAPCTDSSKGWTRGEWLRFKLGHNGSKGPLHLRIKKESTVDDRGCWIWQGIINSEGYGQLAIGRQTRRVHRESYRVFVGPVPAGVNVCHKCDVRACCNPEHLFLGSQADNIADMMIKGRHSNGERPRGEKSPDAKLTEKKVNEIRKLSAQGVGPRELGRRFGVSHPAIRAILLGKTWNHARLPSGE